MTCTSPRQFVRPVIIEGKRDVIGVARVHAAVLRGDPGEQGVERKIDQVAQSRAGRSALRRRPASCVAMRISAATALSSQPRRLKKRSTRALPGGWKKVHDVHAHDDFARGMRQRVVHDAGVHAQIPLRAAVRVELGKQPMQNPPLHVSGVLVRHAEYAHAARLLRHALRAVGRLEVFKLFRGDAPVARRVR